MGYGAKKTLAALTLGVGAAIIATPASADEMSDLKALINEMKSQINEQKSQIRDLRTQVKELNSQVTDQKVQVTDQQTQVKSQGATLQKVEAQQQVIEQKQAAEPQAVAVAAAAPKNEGYWAIPGSKTEFKIGGYVKVDATDDVHANIGTTPDSNFGAIPLQHSAAANRNGQIYYTARESRLNFSTITDTDAAGPVKTFIEADFYGNDGNKGNYGEYFRLRQAYGTAGHWLIGQTWSTFDDLDTAGPEVLDFNGPVGFAAARSPTLRYTAKMGGTAALAVALESPQGSLGNNPAINGATPKNLDRAPDLIVKYTVDPSWGHFALAGMGRYLTDKTGVGDQSSDAMTYGVMAGLGIKTFGKDTLVFQTVDGNGVGSYLIQGSFIDAVMVGDTLKGINTFGGTVGYTHFWVDNLRTNIGLGYDKFDNPSAISSLASLHTNLIWSPWSSTDLGVEYMYGRITYHQAQLDPATQTWADKGTASRIQASAKYSF